MDGALTRRYDTLIQIDQTALIDNFSSFMLLITLI
jgi:hypothetical protein